MADNTMMNNATSPFLVSNVGPVDKSMNSSINKNADTDKTGHFADALDKESVKTTDKKPSEAVERPDGKHHKVKDDKPLSAKPTQTAKPALTEKEPAEPTLKNIEEPSTTDTYTVTDSLEPQNIPDGAMSIAAPLAALTTTKTVVLTSTTVSGEVSATINGSDPLSSTLDTSALTLPTTTDSLANELSVGVTASSELTPVSQELLSQAPIPQPVTPQSVIPQPVITQPVITQPVIPQPVIPQPVIPQPVIPQPVIPQSVIPQSVIPQSVIPQAAIPQALSGTQKVTGQQELKGINSVNSVVLPGELSTVPEEALSVTAIQSVDEQVELTPKAPLLNDGQQAGIIKEPLTASVAPGSSTTVLPEEPASSSTSVGQKTTAEPQTAITNTLLNNPIANNSANNATQFTNDMMASVTEAATLEPSAEGAKLVDAPLTRLAQQPQAAALASGLRLSEQITTPFSQQANWQQSVTDKVMWLSSQNIKHAEIKLDPPELGPLQVKVTVNQDQAHVSFVVASANVRDALDQSSLKLRESFEQEGLDLVDVDVSGESHTEGNSDGDSGGNGGNSNDSGANGEDVETGVTHITHTPSTNLIDAYI